MRIPRWKLIAYALIIVLGVIPALPNLLSSEMRASLPSWFPKNSLTLGLDLRGGSHLVLEVDSKALVQERLQTLAEDARAKLREAKITGATVTVASSAVVATVTDPGQRNDAARALRHAWGPDAT